MKAYHQGQLDYFCGLYAFINALRLICGLDLADARLIFAQTLQELSAYPVLWQAMLDNDTDYYWLLRYLSGRFSQNPAQAFKLGRLPLAPLNSEERQKIRAERSPEQKSALRLYGISEQELRDWLGLKRQECLNLENLQYEHMHERPRTGSKHTDREKNWSMEELWPLLQSWVPVKNLFSSFGNAEKQASCLIFRFHRYLYPAHPPIVSHWTTGMEFKGDTLLLFDCTADKTAVHSLPLKECVLNESDLSRESLIRIEPESIFFMERIK
jgi:hypothetical protein